MAAAFVHAVPHAVMMVMTSVMPALLAAMVAHAFAAMVVAMLQRHQRRLVERRHHRPPWTVLGTFTPRARILKLHRQPEISARRRRQRHRAQQESNH